MHANGHIDPYGCIVFHNAIDCNFNGEKYNKIDHMNLTINKGRFFLRVVSIDS